MLKHTNNSMRLGLLAALLACSLAGAMVYATPRLAAQERGDAAMATLTPDGLYVARALGLALEGNAASELVWPVRFIAKEDMPAADSDLRGNHFYVGAIEFSRYGVIGGEKGSRVVEGLLIHRDPLGRYASTGFRSRYMINSEGSFDVQWATVTPLYAIDPPVRFGIVEAKAVPGNWPSSKTSIAEVEALVREKGIVPEHKMAIPSGVRDYVIVALFMDRIAETDRVSLHVGDRADQVPANEGGNTVVLAEGGWRTVVKRVRLALNGRRTQFIKATLAGPTRDGTAPKIRVVGVLPTRFPVKP
ncbi:MAG: hypothetical protein KIT00_12245 [Rhodospirillales bacterium]|nr:hypothetical protein [Rhodospirillales bacterium]